MQHTNTNLLRQRDEAQRVVLHLRALIDGQAHHMEHIVRNLGDAPASAVGEEQVAAATALPTSSPNSRHGSRASSRASSRLSQREEAAHEVEARLLRNADSRHRLSSIGMNDAVDRNLREKTDAIAYIIRNISEQCAAAVEGLHLAQRADSSTGDDELPIQSNKRSSRAGKRPMRAPISDDGSATSEYGDAVSDTSGSYLAPSRGRPLSIPPTPDLVHSSSGLDRSSTSMSIGSVSTLATPDRQSVQSQWRATIDEDIPEVPTRMVRGDNGIVGELGPEMEEPSTKFSPRGLESRRSMGMRLDV